MRLYNILLLLEGPREDYVIKTYGDKLLDKTGATDIEYVVNYISEFDPSRNKQYLQWMTRQLLLGEIDLIDLESVRDTLTKFEQFKPRLAKKDINQYKFSELRQTVADIDQGRSTDNVVSTRYDDMTDVDIIYRGPYGLMTSPKTQEASCELGSGTRWCTSADVSDNMFAWYNGNGKLYIWIDRSGEKYQFWQNETDEYSIEIKDGRNRDIEVEKLAELMKIPPINKLVTQFRSNITTKATNRLNKLSRVFDLLKYPVDEEVLTSAMRKYRLSWRGETATYITKYIIASGKADEFSKVLERAHDSIVSAGKRVIDEIETDNTPDTEYKKVKTLSLLTFQLLRRTNEFEELKQPIIQAYNNVVNKVISKEDQDTAIRILDDMDKSEIIAVLGVEMVSVREKLEELVSLSFQKALKRRMDNASRTKV